MKNHEHVVTVDKSRHAKLRVKTNADYIHAKGLNLASVALGELSACTANFPVAFVQNPENKQFRPVVMLGLRPGENVYYNEKGWDSTYVPLMIQRHPFTIGFDDREEDSQTLTMCLDKTSPFLSDSDGIAMYTEAGEETEYLQSRRMLLSDIYEGERVTDAFIKMLLEKDLLSPFELLVQPEDGEGRKVVGMYTANERKLRALSDADVAELHKLDYLAALHLILSSLFQIHRMMQLRTEKTGERVNYRLELNPLPTGAAQPVPVA